MADIGVYSVSMLHTRDCFLKLELGVKKNKHMDAHNMFCTFLNTSNINTDWTLFMHFTPSSCRGQRFIL